MDKHEDRKRRKRLIGNTDDFAKHDERGSAGECKTSRLYEEKV
jgi:hypothetical protein